MVPEDLVVDVVLTFLLALKK
uniref:Uncharacterized protein n=1 Tax=Lepeophtheirus salmonis TaxID=72036 RepID=A0A0K2U502_LEPSM